MYPSRFRFPDEPELLDPAPFLAVAIDADKPEAARVEALHTLRGTRRALAHEIGAQLVAVLNEPLLWLGSEAHACLRQLDPDLVVGVDRRGLLAVSPTPYRELLRDAHGTAHCPDLGGPVASIFDVGWLLPHLGEIPPFLAPDEHGAAMIMLRDSDSIRHHLAGLDDSPSRVHGARFEMSRGRLYMNSPAASRQLAAGERMRNGAMSLAVVAILPPGPARARLDVATVREHMTDNATAVAGVPVDLGGGHFTFLGGERAGVVLYDPIEVRHVDVDENADRGRLSWRNVNGRLTIAAVTSR